MIWLLILMVVGVMFYIIVKCKNENANNKNKLLKIIITINIVVVCILNIILPFVREINSYGLIAFILVNILLFFFSDKINNKKSIFMVTVAAYFIIMCIIPVYKFEDHRHTFEHNKTITSQLPDGTEITSPLEKIEKYTVYYNCYSVKLFAK